MLNIKLSHTYPENPRKRNDMRKRLVIGGLILLQKERRRNIDEHLVGSLVQCTKQGNFCKVEASVSNIYYNI